MFLLKKSLAVAYKATLQPDGPTVEVQAGETLLDALLRNEIDIPYECHVGSCTECKCRILDGQVKEQQDSAYVLEKDELDNGYVLACQSILISDIVFTYEVPD